MADLREIVPSADVRIVLNGVRRGPVGPDPETQLASAFDRYAGMTVAAFVPYDRAGCDAMLSAGRLLAECASGLPIGALAPLRESAASAGRVIVATALATPGYGRASRR